MESRFLFQDLVIGLGTPREKRGLKKTHGLRKLAATMAASGGATAYELMSQFGWTNSKQAEVYTKGLIELALE